MPAILAPTRYHQALRDALRDLEPGMWRFFSSSEHWDRFADEVKVELLKRTYRMPESAHPELYEATREVASLLGVTAPVTLYKEQNAVQANARVLFVPGEVHIVLAGPVLNVLQGAELKALLGREIGHHKLWTEDGGSYWVADVLLCLLAGGPNAPSSFVQSAMRYARWTELYADRAGLTACGDVLASVGCLLKVETDLTSADPAAYIQQAEEVLGKASVTCETPEHPESFLRAHALKLWHEAGEGCDAELSKLIEGPTTLEALDLVGQRDATGLTRTVLSLLLSERWFSTEANLAHARRFFPDFEAPGAACQAELSIAPGLADYLAYVLLDFAVVDPDLETAALAHVVKTAGALGIAESFEKDRTKRS